MFISIVRYGVLGPRCMPAGLSLRKLFPPTCTASLRTRAVARLRGLPLSGKGGGEVTHRMFLVTGGAGFIGSNVVASLNEAGHSDIVVNDTIDTGEKWRNLGKRQLAD